MDRPSAAEKPGVAGNAAQSEGILVMHDTLHKTLPPGTEFGGGHIREYRRCCMIAETKRRPAVVQTKRRIDLLDDQSVEPFT